MIVQIEEKRRRRKKTFASRDITMTTILVVLYCNDNGVYLFKWKK